MATYITKKNWSPSAYVIEIDDPVAYGDDGADSKGSVDNTNRFGYLNKNKAQLIVAETLLQVTPLMTNQTTLSFHLDVDILTNTYVYIANEGAFYVPNQIVDGAITSWTNITGNLFMNVPQLSLNNNGLVSDVKTFTKNTTNNSLKLSSGDFLQKIFLKVLQVNGITPLKGTNGETTMFSDEQTMLNSKITTQSQNTSGAFSVKRFHGLDVADAEFVWEELNGYWSFRTKDGNLARVEAYDILTGQTINSFETDALLIKQYSFDQMFRSSSPSVDKIIDSSFTPSYFGLKKARFAIYNTIRFQKSELRMIMFDRASFDVRNTYSRLVFENIHNTYFQLTLTNDTGFVGTIDKLVELSDVTRCIFDISIYNINCNHIIWANLNTGTQSSKNKFNIQVYEGCTYANGFTNLNNSYVSGNYHSGTFKTYNNCSRCLVNARLNGFPYMETGNFNS